MHESIVAIMLTILPWSWTAKTIALAVMWWTLSRKTVSTGPLGIDINISFRDQAIMSFIATLMMVVIWIEVDPADIQWPFIAALLAAGVLWPFRAARSHYRVWWTYRRIAREKERGDR